MPFSSVPAVIVISISGSIFGDGLPKIDKFGASHSAILPGCRGPRPQLMLTILCRSDENCGSYRSPTFTSLMKFDIPEERC